MSAAEQVGRGDTERPLGTGPPPPAASFPPRPPELGRVRATVAELMRMPVDAPVRRLAVRLAAIDANARRDHRCGCGERYLAVGNPPTFHDSEFAERRFLCRNAKCRAVL